MYHAHPLGPGFANDEPSAAATIIETIVPENDAGKQSYSKEPNRSMASFRWCTGLIISKFHLINREKRQFICIVPAHLAISQDGGGGKAEGAKKGSL